MAEPSLLCVNCARPPPAHRRTWGRCTVCVERNLPSTYYCGEECMHAHWPKHKVHHKQQKQEAQMRESTVLDRDRSLAEAEARRAERTGDEFDKRYADALAIGVKGDLYAEAKAWRKMIKQWPEEPAPYHSLAVVLHQSRRVVEAAPLFLKAIELYDEGNENWAQAVAAAFDQLKLPECREVPTPEWWNDEALKALSARGVAVSPDGHIVCAMRARVLSGDAFYEAHWNAGPRTAAEIKEAASWFRRAAMMALIPADKLPYERSASRCDEYADPLLAEEEAEASKARAAVAAEEAEALKVAEAKAAAAAGELLAEEEKEKQQASTKASKTKQGKGKKGKGTR